jgi:hypothetical protein
MLRYKKTLTESPRLPVKAPMSSCILQVFPVGLTVSSTFPVLLEHVLLSNEKLGSKVLPDTKQATWPSAVGVAPAVKAQVSPLLQGRGPVTGKMLPDSWY